MHLKNLILTPYNLKPNNDVGRNEVSARTYPKHCTSCAVSILCGAQPELDCYQRSRSLV
jgi:hypothetical protein